MLLSFIFQVLQLLYYGGQQLVLGRRLLSVVISSSLSFVSCFKSYHCFWRLQYGDACGRSSETWGLVFSQ